MKFYFLILLTCIALMSSLAFSDPLKKLGQINFVTVIESSANNARAPGFKFRRAIILNDLKVALVFKSNDWSGAKRFFKLIFLDFNKNISEVQKEFYDPNNTLDLEADDPIREIFHFNSSKTLVVFFGTKFSSSVKFIDLETRAVKKEQKLPNRIKGYRSNGINCLRLMDTNNEIYRIDVQKRHVNLEIFPNEEIPVGFGYTLEKKLDLPGKTYYFSHNKEHLVITKGSECDYGYNQTCYDELSLWNTVTMDEIKVVDCDGSLVKGRVKHAIFSPDSRYLVVANSNMLYFNAINTGEPIGQHEFLKNGGILKFSKNGDILYLVNANRLFAYDSSNYFQADFHPEN